MACCFVQVSCPGKEGANANRFKHAWTKFLAAKSDKVEILLGGRVTKTLLKLESTWEDDGKERVSGFSSTQLSK